MAELALLLAAVVLAVVVLVVASSFYRKGNKDGARQIVDGAPMAELFPIRDFLDDVMVRTDGCYVAGYRLQGSHTYFGGEVERNGVNLQLDALFRACQEESMRIQVRYEVDDNAEHVLKSYEDARNSDFQPAIDMDEQRVERWRGRAAAGEFLSRKVTIYFIWSPETHRKVMLASGTKIKGSMKSGSSPRRKDCIQIEREEHDQNILQFQALLRGIESTMNAAELKPTRLTHRELFSSTQDAIGPFCPVRSRMYLNPVSDHEMSVRDLLATVHLDGLTESYISIDRTLWGVVTLKDPPERTFPGIIRKLLILGFPLTISTNIEIPDQTKILNHYQKSQKKMRNAQVDLRGRPRHDAVAAQVEKELGDISSRILASSTKACKVSISVAFRTSFQANTTAEFEKAEQQLAERRQQIIHSISAMDGAVALPESMAAQLRMFIDTLPGLASKNKREIDMLTANAANLAPVEMPWQGTPQTPQMLFTDPYRQLIPYSPFDASHENANAIISAASGSGKSMLVQQMLMTAARQNVRVSILERGDSYYHTVKYMGGEMITMSLDSPHVINPFDLEPGQIEPTKDQLSFLKSLLRHMIGDTSVSDSDILDSVIIESIISAYQRAQLRDEGRKVPRLRDVKDDLSTYVDPKKNDLVMREAHVAAHKLQAWCEDGMFANLFDRYTTVNMNTDWLYFNVEQLKDDPKLETAMSFLIAYATTRRSGGGKRCINVFDECWSLFDTPCLHDAVLQLFRTARKRDACVWGISQAVEDFTGTPEKPNPIGGPILATTSLRMIGRQKGNMDVLRDFLHLSEAAIQKIKSMGSTEKGKQSEFLICVGERSETTHSLIIQLTPLEYWLATSYPRERTYRKWWLKSNNVIDFAVAMKMLAEKFPNGLAYLPQLAEERSGEVNKDFAVEAAA